MNTEKEELLGALRDFEEAYNNISIAYFRSRDALIKQVERIEREEEERNRELCEMELNYIGRI